VMDLEVMLVGFIFEVVRICVADDGIEMKLHIYS
jgi:hypothetical protein